MPTYAGNIKGLLREATELTENDHFTEALSLLSRVLDADPNNFDALFAQASIMEKDENISAAMPIIEIMMKFH